MSALAVVFQRLTRVPIRAAGRRWYSVGRELRIPCMTVLTATVTCPHCGHKATEAMLTNACVHLYECTGFGRVLRPKPGDCCVFSFYGLSRCPPQQQEGAWVLVQSPVT